MPHHPLQQVPAGRIAHFTLAMAQYPFCDHTKNFCDHNCRFFPIALHLVF
jgi:hypothetical protein